MFFILHCLIAHFISVETKKCKTLGNISAGQEKVSQEIIELKKKIQLAKDTLIKFKNKYSEAQAEISN